MKHIYFERLDHYLSHHDIQLIIVLLHSQLQDTRRLRLKSEAFASKKARGGRAERFPPHSGCLPLGYVSLHKIAGILISSTCCWSS